VDAWTVRFTDKGEPSQLELMSETDAKTLLGDVWRLIDPAAELVDLVAEIAARLPIGGRVRHTVHGWTGRVVHDRPGGAPFFNIPHDTPLAYVPTNTYTGVCVRWDNGAGTAWYDAAFIEPIGDTE
jgi:hypothetical protein